MTQKNIRILVVDDEANAREGLRKLLKLEGYEIVVAEDGVAALERASDQPPDVVVTDLKMPRMDGLELTRRLRGAGDTTPILMLTARDAIDDRVAGLDAGADDYLVKPFAFSELLARVRSVLRRGPNRHPGLLRVADLKIDVMRHHAVRGTQRLDLTPSVAASRRCRFR